MPVELDALIRQLHHSGILYSEADRKFRKAFIATVLRANNGNQSKAARALGMHRNTLSRTMSILGLDVHARRARSHRLPQNELRVTVVERIAS